MNSDKLKFLHEYKIKSCLPYPDLVLRVSNRARIFHDVKPSRIKIIIEKKPKPVISSGKVNFKAYKKAVWEITESVKHLIEGIELRGFKDHHIDHKISIWQGFKSNIPAHYIGDIPNLRMIPYKENMIKGTRSFID